MINLEAYRDELVDRIENEGCSLWKALDAIHRDVEDRPLDVDEMISWLLEEYEEPLLNNQEKATINSLTRGLFSTLVMGDDDSLKNRIVVYKNGIDLCIGAVSYLFKPEDAPYAADVNSINTFITLPIYKLKCSFNKLEDNKYYLLKEIL